MKNVKTTTAGYIALAAAVFQLLNKMVNGGDVDMNDLIAISNAAAGVGLIMAKDGRH